MRCVWGFGASSVRVGSQCESVPSTLCGDFVRKQEVTAAPDGTAASASDATIPPGQTSQHSMTHRQLASKQFAPSSGGPRRPRTEDGATEWRHTEPEPGAGKLGTEQIRSAVSRHDSVYRYSG
jgi:hypothetical protein